MRGVAELLNAMRSAGVILDYALFGAVAQMRYTEAVSTLDADVLVALPSPERLAALAPIYEFCRNLGHEPEGEAVKVGAWPVQFIPVFSELTREALEQAETVDFEGIPLRVIRADYLGVIALGVGRAKDFARVLALLESNAVTREELAALAKRHDLSAEYERFETRFFDE